MFCKFAPNRSSGTLSALLVAAGLAMASIAANAAPITGQGTWETTLRARDISGNAVALDDASAAFFYDTVLDITWLSDWNYPRTSGYNANVMNWADAVFWADQLVYGGFDDWRLPTSSLRSNCFGSSDCSLTEMGYLWYQALGNSGSLSNTATFMNMTSRSAYWTGTELVATHSFAFWIGSGNQYYYNKGNGLGAVAVRDGDVASVVPEPTTLALLGLGLAGLGFSRRKQ